MSVTLQSGRVVVCPAGTPVAELAARESLSPRDEAFAAWVNGKLVDLSFPLAEDCLLRLVGFAQEEGQEIYRHSVSHLMAQAVRRLFPETRLATGPAIADGFYYDFLAEKPFVPEDLARIEEEMHRLVEADLTVTREVVSREEGRRRFSEAGEKLKVDLLDEIEEPEVSLYHQGEFVDLCRGPHVSSTGRLRHFKLLSSAAAHWRGDETGESLQRIYGTAWDSAEELELHLTRLAEAKERDHRRLGPALDLFSIHEEAGGGLVHWHPHGNVIRSIIEDLWRREHQARGYQLVTTPHLGRARQWRRSGHFDFYRKELYIVQGDEGEDEFVLKPMNCLGHIHIYRSRLRSYRELPLRLAELGTVYRRERPGVLHGLLRVRGFTQDDAHIFCSREDLPGEIRGVIELALHMLRTFGFSQFEIELSVADPERPEEYAGERPEWEWAEKTLDEVLTDMELSFTRNVGEAAFYGPKVDIHLLDALGRRWQGPTIQLDFNLPARFNVNYVGPDGNRHMVFMIHRTVLGSLERFTGTLIEHYAGNFPLWLAPVQVTVLPVSRDQGGYGEEISAELERAGVRAEIDRSDEKIGLKIRRAELAKIPFMLVVGRREKEARTVSVRRHGVGDEGPRELGRFIADVEEEVRHRGRVAGSQPSEGVGEKRR